MSRNLSLNAIIAIHAQETGEVILPLLTLSHPTEMTETIRIVRNTQAITSRGNTYLPVMFDVVLPSEGTETIPEVKLTLLNAQTSEGVSVAQLLESLGDAPNVLIELILASSPDTVEYDTGTMKMNGFNFDRGMIETSLTAGDFMNEPFPGDSFSKTNFPGLY